MKPQKTLSQPSLCQGTRSSFINLLKERHLATSKAQITRILGQTPDHLKSNRQGLWRIRTTKLKIITITIIMMVMIYNGNLKKNDNEKKKKKDKII